MQFEIWAIIRIGGTPNQEKDRGVDGLFWFRDGKEEKTGLIQVKSGKIKPGDIYEKSVSIDSLEKIKSELKTHRLFSTHKEINQINTLIDKEKYMTHVATKKDAANEINSIVKNLQ